MSIPLFLKICRLQQQIDELKECQDRINKSEICKFIEKKYHTSINDFKDWGSTCAIWFNDMVFMRGDWSFFLSDMDNHKLYLSAIMYDKPERDQIVLHFRRL